MPHREAARGLSWLNEDRIAERGARMARRDDREYREYLREEQRRQPGCPAREVVLDQRGQATKPSALAQLLERPFQLVELLSRLAQFPLGGQPLIVGQILCRTRDQRLHIDLAWGRGTGRCRRRRL